MMWAMFRNKLDFSSLGLSQFDIADTSGERCHNLVSTASPCTKVFMAAGFSAPNLKIVVCLRGKIVFLEWQLSFCWLPYEKIMLKSDEMTAVQTVEAVGAGGGEEGPAESLPGFDGPSFSKNQADPVGLRGDPGHGCSFCRPCELSFHKSFTSWYI